MGKSSRGKVSLPKSKTQRSKVRAGKKRKRVGGGGGGTVVYNERIIKEVNIGGGTWVATPVPDPPSGARRFLCAEDGIIFWGAQ